MERPAFLFIDYKAFAEKISKASIRMSPMTRDPGVEDIEEELNDYLKACKATEEAARTLLGMCAYRRLQVDSARMNKEELAKRFSEQAAQRKYAQ